MIRESYDSGSSFFVRFARFVVRNRRGGLQTTNRNCGSLNLRLSHPRDHAWRHLFSSSHEGHRRERSVAYAASHPGSRMHRVWTRAFSGNSIRMVGSFVDCWSGIASSLTKAARIVGPQFGTIRNGPCPDPIHLAVSRRARRQTLAQGIEGRTLRPFDHGSVDSGKLFKRAGQPKK